MGGGWRNIAVREDVYLALNELKYIYRVRSFNAVIRRLIEDAHGGGFGAGGPAKSTETSES